MQGVKRRGYEVSFICERSAVCAMHLVVGQQVHVCVQPAGQCCDMVAESPCPFCLSSFHLHPPAGIKSELSVGSVKAIHSLVTRIGEEGLPFVSWVPANWREISTEQKDRSLPQHVHQPTDWEKDKGKKMWMIPWRTDTVQ